MDGVGEMGMRFLALSTLEVTLKRGWGKLERFGRNFRRWGWTL